MGVGSQRVQEAKGCRKPKSAGEGRTQGKEGKCREGREVASDACRDAQLLHVYSTRVYTCVFPDGPVSAPTYVVRGHMLL